MSQQQTFSIANLEPDQLPQESGVYLFKNSQNQPVYIGKAGNLKKRLSYYFRPGNQRGKIKKITTEGQKLTVITTPGEFDALLLEARLIKKYQPKYNVLQKDDKHYLYIAVTDEKFPRVKTARRQEEGILFGPFPSAKTVRLVLKEIRKIFPYRSCRRLPDQPCLYHNINLCPAPCLHQKDSQFQKKYQNIITSIEKVLSGQTDRLIKQYRRQMKKAAKSKDFEKAARLKKIINGLNVLTEKRIDPNLFLADVDLRETKKGNLEDLYQLLEPYFTNLPRQLKRIEGYDIANIKEEAATGSLVVFTQGQPNPNQYRRFKIKGTTGPDDPGMIKEVLSRRLKHQEWDTPDLIVVDGGKTQLSAAQKAIGDRDIPAIGLTKKEEKIIVKTAGDFKEISIDPDSKPLLLLRALRNEAHRFAQKYHHLLRSKSYRHS